MRGRHPNVDDDELGRVLAYELEELTCVAGLTDDLKTGSLEQAGEAFAEEDVVVGHDDPGALVRGRIDRPSTLRAPTPADQLPALSPLEGSGYMKTLSSG